MADQTETLYIHRSRRSAIADQASASAGALERPQPLAHRTVVDRLGLRLDLEKRWRDPGVVACAERVAQELTADRGRPCVDREPGDLDGSFAPARDLQRGRAEDEPHELGSEAGRRYVVHERDGVEQSSRGMSPADGALDP